MFIVYSGIAWAIGLWLASQFSIPLAWVTVGGVIGCFGGAWLGRHSDVGRQGFLLCGVMGMAVLRLAWAQPTIDENHIAFYNGGTRTTVVGVIEAEPVVGDRFQRLILDVSSVTLTQATRPVSGRLVVLVPRYPLLTYDTKVRVNGTLATPGEFDTTGYYRAYLARQGVHSVMYYPQVEVLEEDAGNIPFYYKPILSLKARAQQIINQHIPEPSAALLSGILLGNESNMLATLSESFRLTGMTHIIAISGFNISLLAGIFLVVLTPIAGKRRAAWFAIGGLGLYTILVGADASVVRAFLMGSLYIVSIRLLGRPVFPYAPLFLAGILMTLHDPFALWDVGFQLSFAATLGLMLYADPMTRTVRRWLSDRLTARVTTAVMGVISEGVLITISAQLTTLPLLLYYFNQLSLISLPANFLILPVQPTVMIFGGLTVLAGLLFPLLAQVLGWVAWLFLAYSIWWVQVLAEASFATIPFRLSGSGVVVLYALLATVTYYRWQTAERRKQIREALRTRFRLPILVGSAGIMASLTLLWGWSQPDGYLHIHFLDVGAGQATFIQTPTGRQLLIDGGSTPTLINDHMGRVMPYWDRKVDVVIVTRSHRDYVMGLPNVLQRFQVGQVWISEEDAGNNPAYDAFLEMAGQQEIALTQVTEQQQLWIGDGVQVDIMPAFASTPMRVAVTYGDLSLVIGEYGTRVDNPTVWVGRVEEGEEGDLPASQGAVVLPVGELGSVELISDGNTIWWQAWRRH